ncbi:unnamed protein product [Ambrosiozyma monospora]|uniref:Unnamed protein product n=1 Tax=Ambrosiozyma monospora TaxID=43982 RepID=A0A9W6Z4T2_AMBMO|nr:unnamed protein product [Ambrosiozyma monospora]
MSFLKNMQGFFHSLTTYDHYAPFDEDERPKAQPGSTLHPNSSSQSITMLDNTSSVSLNQRNSSSARPSVQYRPGLRSQLTNQRDIQLNDFVDGQPPLPSIATVWERLDNWLDREFPELGDDMDEGATVNDLNAFEKDMGISLPLDIRDSYQIHDGQLSFGKTRGLVYSYPLMDLESVAAETNIWRKAGRLMTEHLAKEAQREAAKPVTASSSSAAAKDSKVKKVDFMARQGSCPQGYIQPMYYNPNWIPIVKDNGGNNIALDLAPGPRGRYGQVILYGRDFDTKFLVANSFTEFLLTLTEDLEEGRFTIDEIDEDLLFFDRGRTYPYFQVLRARSIALDRSMHKKAPVPGNAKAQPGGPGSALNSRSNSQAELSSAKASKVSLPKETLISPINSTNNLSKHGSPVHSPTSANNDNKPSESSKLKNQFSTATNDSFVLEDEEEAELHKKEEEEEAKAKAQAKDAKEDEEDVKDTATIIAAPTATETTETKEEKAVEEPKKSEEKADKKEDAEDDKSKA